MTVALVLGVVGRVEVRACAPRTRRRRCRPSCRPACTPSRGARRAHVLLGGAGERARCARRRSPSPWRSRSRAERRRAGARPRSRRSPGCCGGTTGSMRVSSRTCVQASDRRGRRRRWPTAAARSGSRRRRRSSASSCEVGRLEAVAAGLERAHRLLQRLLEGAADRHRLADRLHLRAEHVARLPGTSRR